MAISPMKKVTLIANKYLLDELLLHVQRMHNVHVQPYEEPKESENINSFSLQEQNQLLSISDRLNAIELTIERLGKYQPNESMFEKLKTAKSELTFEDFHLQEHVLIEQETILETNRLVDRLKEIGELKQKRKTQIEKYRRWEDLDVTLKKVENFQHVNALIGTVPNVENNQYMQALKTNQNVAFKVIYLNDMEYGLVILHSSERKDELKAFLESIKFSHFDFPYRTLPKEKLESWRQEVNDLEKERKAIELELASKKNELHILKVQADYVRSQFDRESTKEKLIYTSRLVAVEGWIEEVQEKNFIKKIEERFANDVVIRVESVANKDLERVPIKLNNHPLVKPFEIITNMYALPKYNEIDPTPFLMPFYFVFFGMMVADLGYGLLVFLVSLGAKKLFKLTDSTKNSLNFAMILGVGIAIWGGIYGSFFGFPLPYQLINPSEDVMLVLGLSVVLGLIHIFVALGLNIYLKMKEKDWIEAYAQGLAWIFLLASFIMMGAGSFKPEYQTLAVIGKWLAIVNAIGILIASVLKAKGLGGLGWGLYDLYSVTGYVGDLVSYTRLMALGLSGGSIALAFNMIIQFLPPIAQFTVGIVLFVILHSLSMFLSMLSAYVHGARLIFVEFFAKFYTGGGKPFQPLSLSEKYVEIHDDLSSN